MAFWWNRLAEPALAASRWALALAGVVVLAGCSSGVPDAGPLVSDAKRLALSDDGSGKVVQYAQAPTVTLYPTFTPAVAPAPTDAPLPTATMVGVLPPVAAPTLTPTPYFHTVVVAPGPTPTPEPTVELAFDGLRGALMAHTFFGLHTPPGVGEPMPVWPDGEEVFLKRTTRYLVWYLLFDHSRIDGSTVETCLMRVTMQAGPPEQRREHVVHQEPVEVKIELEAEGNVTQVILGLGGQLPGAVWESGDYTFELWDSRDRVVAAWEFKVG